MDRTHSQNRLIWSIVILAVLNLASLSALWLLRLEHERPRPPRKDNERLEDIIVRRIGLDREQEARFRELHARHRTVKDSLEDNVFRLKTQIQDELFAEAPDTLKLAALTARIGNLQAEFERQVALHSLDLKALCRPEQYRRLQAVLDDLLNAAKRRPNPGPEQPRGEVRRPDGPHRQPPR